MLEINVKETYLSVSGTILSKEDLTQLSQCTKMTSLWIQSCQVEIDGEIRLINDTDLGYLKAMTKLASLCISHSNITDEGLFQLAEFKKLEMLNLDYTQIEGKGFIAFKDHPTLDCIWVQNSQLKDENLMYLKEIPKLETLLLDHTNVTEENAFILADSLILSLGSKGFATPDFREKFKLEQIKRSIKSVDVDENIKVNILEVLRKFMALKAHFAGEGFRPVEFERISKTKVNVYYIQNDMSISRFQLNFTNDVWNVLNFQTIYRRRWSTYDL